MPLAAKPPVALLTLLATACISNAVCAEEPATDDTADADVRQLNTVTILGTDGSADGLGGSAHYLGPEVLERFEYADVMRVVRSVPGVYVQDEEGYGLRPNIGIRGSGLDRSSRIAVLEDGVLIAPAPYAAPAAYYFPTQRRMQGMEVLKGPAAINVGPRTTGGALNLISSPIPDENSGRVAFLYGENDTIDTHAWYGASSERYGLLVETVQQDTDGFKDLDSNDRNDDTGFDLQDYLVKARVGTRTDARWYTDLELKFGYTDQTSRASYLGLTDDDFDSDHNRRYAASQIDRFESDHTHRQATWRVEPSHLPWRFAVTGYDLDFNRNWYKIETVNGTRISTILADPDTYGQELEWIRGDEDSPDDTLTLRNNNREYYSRGVQARGAWDLKLAGGDLTLTGGVRVHEDEEDRFQSEDDFRMESGNLVLTTRGEPGSHSNRVSDADVTAYFAKADWTLGPWAVSPGIRYEDADLTRKDYATDDPGRLLGPTRVRQNNVDEWIPGASVVYALGPGVQMLGGVHEGYNPPAPGSTADPEESTNYEFGTRIRTGPVTTEAVAFFTDYDNLVGTVTESTGGGGEVGDQFDGGEAEVRGLELTMDWTLLDIASTGISMPVNVTYTWTEEAEFKNSFDSDFGAWGEVESGDDLPYIPEHQGRLYVGLVGGSWLVNANITYQDETRTRAGSGSIPGNEATDEYWVVDLAAEWQLIPRLALRARVDNVFDDTHIVARRPSGVRPGRERTAFLGFAFDL